MVFHSTRKVVRYPVLVINNTLIERVTNFNYLGLQLSNDLNWDKHKCVISLRLTKTIGVLNLLRYEYPEEILLTLYNTLRRNTTSFKLLHITLGGKYWKYTQIAEKSFTDYF